jgi:hypothetical protein
MGHLTQDVADGAKQTAGTNQSRWKRASMTTASQYRATTSTDTNLAFDRHGGGVPIVLLPGLTFGRGTLRALRDRRVSGAL